MAVRAGPRPRRSTCRPGPDWAGHFPGRPAPAEGIGAARKPREGGTPSTPTQAVGVRSESAPVCDPRSRMPAACERTRPRAGTGVWGERGRRGCVQASGDPVTACDLEGISLLPTISKFGVFYAFEVFSLSLQRLL